MLDSASILLVDGERRLRHALTAQLEADGAIVHRAVDSAGAIEYAGVHRPDVVIVGALPTPAAAVTLIRALRSSAGLEGEPDASVAILAVVDGRDEMAALRCFEAGADDVVARRGGYPVLRCRMRVLLGSAGRQAVVPSAWRAGPVELNAVSREVRLRGELVAVSAKEFALLSALIAEPRRVFTRDELLRDVWGFRAPALTRCLDSHAARLRRKLGRQGDALIINVWGVGYRLIDGPAAELERAA